MPSEDSIQEQSIPDDLGLITPKEEDETINQEKKALTTVPTTTTSRPATRSAPAAPSAADQRFPRPQSFPSESWPTPPLTRVESPRRRDQLAAELKARPEGSPETWQRLVITTTIASYVGDRLNGDAKGVPHGHGRAEFKAGQIYEGEWSYGLMHGQGCYTWRDGTSYTGTMEQQSATGFGLIVWPDGSTYQGEVRDGYRHGEGIFIDPSVPCLYEGSWEHGLRHGKGKLTYDEPGNSYYEGLWVEGARHGYGLLRYKSGNLYEGNWVWDRKVGRGTMNWFTLNQRYIGNWLNDLPDGEGEYTWLDLPVSSVKQFEAVRSVGGNTINKSNQLVTHFQHHNRYVGQFVQGVRNGRGTFHYSNGSIYDGEWVNDRKHGTGRFTFANGSTYEGAFTNDTMSDNNKWKHPYSGVADALENLSLTTATAPAAASPPPATPNSAIGRNAKALEAATTTAQKDIGMFDLPLDDVLTRHAESMGLGQGNQAAPAFIAAQRDALINVLLRYNTELLDIYRFYSQLEVDISHPEYRAPVLPFQPLSPTNALGREHVSANPANVSARMNLAQMWAFIADLGLIGQKFAPNLTLATLDRLILAGTAEANRKLLPDLKNLHDGRQVLLLREFAGALIRIAEVFYETPQETASVVVVAENDEKAAEPETENPNLLYTQAQERFNSMLTGIEPTTAVASTNDLSLPLASIQPLSPPRPGAGGSPLSGSPHQVKTPGSSASKLHSRLHSRQASGHNTPVQPASTTRSGGSASAITVQTHGGKFAPFSSTGGSITTSPLSSTSQLLSPQLLAATQSLAAKPPQPNTLSVRFKRFLVEFVLPKARTRSKNGFGPSWTGSTLFRDHSITKLGPIYRIPTIITLVKRYEQELYHTIFLPASSIPTRTLTSLQILDSSPPLFDRVIRLADALEFLKTHSTCFNTFFTYYHALDILFGLQNYSDDSIYPGLSRELLWEEFLEVLVRIALYRGKILATVSDSLTAERAALAAIEFRRKEEADALAAEARAKAAEAEAAATAQQAALDEKRAKSKSPGLVKPNKPAAKEVAAKPNAAIVKSPSQKKDLKVKSDPATTKAANGSAKKKSSPTDTPTTPSIPSTPTTAPVDSQPPPHTTTTAPVAATVTAPVDTASVLGTPVSGRHQSHVSLESGSLRRASSKKLQQSPAAAVPAIDGLNEDLAALSVNSPTELVSPRSQQFTIDAEKWTADVEAFFCTVLNKHLPDGVQPSFPINILMV